MADYSFYLKWGCIFVDSLIKDFNLDADSAIAIVGNGGHESGGFKSLQEKKPVVPGSRGGYGIMQWTGPRRREYEAYCKRNGLDPSDMTANYKFLFVELSGPEGRVLPKLRSAKSLEDKVRIFSEGFLRPGIPHMESRQVWAKRLKAAWEAEKPTPVVVDTPPVSPAPEPVDKPSETGPVDKKSFWDLLLEFLKAIGVVK